jgi:hypothetical protein
MSVRYIAYIFHRTRHWFHSCAIKQIFHTYGPACAHVVPEHTQERSSDRKLFICISVSWTTAVCLFVAVTGRGSLYRGRTSTCGMLPSAYSSIRLSFLCQSVGVHIVKMCSSLRRSVRIRHGHRPSPSSSWLTGHRVHCKTTHPPDESCHGLQWQQLLARRTESIHRDQTLVLGISNIPQIVITRLVDQFSS